MRKSYKGTYRLKNRAKYKGDPTKIVWRSLLERSFMVWCDNNPNIIQWQSEEVVIPYISPVDGKKHRYFPDFTITNTENETTIIEVKPESQTMPPIEPKKETRKTKLRYLNECKTFVVNTAKWDAALAYCNRKGYKFSIITEHDIKNIVKTGRKNK